MSFRGTIFALSSGQPPAAIAVIRISGPRAGAALEALMGRLPEPRKGAFARVRDPASGEIIDEALALWFPGPASETGEDVAELQIHGGRAVIAATFEALSRVDGLRPAEAGEFTRRAFENGKLDLTRVEGLADLIGAETEAQRRQALRQLRGLLGDRAEAWRRRLIEALALVEAQIDFPDEGDVPTDLVPKAVYVARELFEDIRKTLDGSRRSERLRDGLVVAIAGPPNSGKSSLLNTLARRDVAIVSPIAGTTRDVIEVHLDLGGYPVTLLDTAGIRDSDDPIEQEGVRRARARADEADLVLWLADASSENQGSSFSENANGAAAVGVKGRVWLLWTKIDISDRSKINNIKSGLSIIYNKSYVVSSVTGEGIPKLIEALGIFSQEYFALGGSGLIGRIRQRTALEEALSHLNSAISPNSATDIELFAEDLRLAARALGRLTGRIDVEDILDVIFRDFCIGK
jgi:tRNA modification GTPase